MVTVTQQRGFFHAVCDEHRWASEPYRSMSDALDQAEAHEHFRHSPETGERFFDGNDESLLAQIEATDASA